MRVQKKRRCVSTLSAILAASTFFGTLTLAGCASADAVNYSHEETIGVIEAGNEIYRTLEEKLAMLVLDSAEISEFEGAKEAFGLFFDSVLNYMSGKNYARYAGNSELIDAVNEKYPELDVIEAIPASELEATMYENFGGNVKLSHGSSRLFRYLDDADVYVPVTSPVSGGVEIKVQRILETENTYRIEFSLSAGESLHDYVALAVKREDGSCYFETLLENK